MNLPSRNSSIRIPSAFNGLYGLRPSYGRIPYAGALSILEGSDTTPAVFGPIAHDIRSIKIFMKSVLSTNPWLKDPLAVRKSWNEEAYQLREHGSGKQMCFAICWSNGDITPQPPVTRAMELVKAALVAAGHKGQSCHSNLLVSGLLSEQWSTGTRTGMSRCTVFW